MKQKNFLKTSLLLFTFVLTTHFSYGQYTGTGTFTKITSVTDIVDDAYYVIIDKSENYAMNNVHSGTLDKTDITPSSNSLTDPASSIVWEIKTNGAGRSIFNAESAKFLSYTGSSNNVQVVDAVTLDNQRWDITYVGDEFKLANIAVSTRRLQYNASAPRFACYASNQVDIAIYKMPIAANATIGFDEATSAQNETDGTVVTAGIPITLTDYALDVTVTPTVDLDNSTADVAGYTIDLAPLEFTANGTLNIPLSINNDADILDGTIVINFTVTSGTADLGTASHTATITDDDGLITTWTGVTTAVWANGANWSNGIPEATNDVTIPDVGTAPIIGTDISAVVKNMTIAHAGGLTINAGNLTIEGNLTIATGSNLTSNSLFTGSKTIDAATVIVKGTYSSVDDDKFIYVTETFNADLQGWTIISSPTVGEEIADVDGDESGFTLFNALQKSETPSTNVNYGIAPYDNSQVLPENRWAYYTTSEIEGTLVIGVPNSIPMVSGKGYTVLPSTAGGAQENGKLSFKGALPVADVSIAITDASIDDGTPFNAIGNPYPSFITVADFLTTNSAVLTEGTLWFWDKTSAAYITVNNTTVPARSIAPAQGFFVESITAGGSISFTEAMQSHQATGTFNRTVNTRPEIQLNMTNNGVSKNTVIYYYDNKTTGFDNGYDSSMFGGIPSSLAVYTKLVATDDNRSLAIQTLPTSNYETMVIPVGVKATANSEITFSANALHLQEGLNVYLEDRLNNTFTRLDIENAEYKTTVNDVIDENRFYLHTKTASTLSISTEFLDTITIYKTDNYNLRIKGLQKGNAKISIFSVLGKNIMNTSFEASSVKNITLPNLASGVYIVKLETEEGSLNKKIILE
jgi:hypothetical protein